MESAPEVDLTAVLSLLLDADRLAILGQLALANQTPQPLAQALRRKEMHVVHHLEKLAQGGLIEATGTPGEYRLARKSIERMARHMAAERKAGAPPTVEVPGIAGRYFQADGRLKFIPTQSERFKSVLTAILPVIPAGETFSERQINEILSRFHEDTAELRRGLVDHGHLTRNRDGSAYRRTNNEGGISG